jgi:hypothetical protein
MQLQDMQVPERNFVPVVGSTKATPPFRSEMFVPGLIPGRTRQAHLMPWTLTPELEILQLVIVMSSQREGFNWCEALQRDIVAATFSMLIKLVFANRGAATPEPSSGIENAAISCPPTNTEK